jgi:hypothetical protein
MLFIQFLIVFHGLSQFSEGGISHDGWILSILCILYVPVVPRIVVQEDGEGITVAEVEMGRCKIKRKI